MVTQLETYWIVKSYFLPGPVALQVSVTTSNRLIWPLADSGNCSEDDTRVVRSILIDSSATSSDNASSLADTKSVALNSRHFKST